MIAKRNMTQVATGATLNDEVKHLHGVGHGKSLAHEELFLPRRSR